MLQAATSWVRLCKLLQQHLPLKELSKAELGSWVPLAQISFADFITLTRLLLLLLLLLLGSISWLLGGLLHSWLGGWCWLTAGGRGV